MIYLSKKIIVIIITILAIVPIAYFVYMNESKAIILYLWDMVKKDPALAIALAALLYTIIQGLRSHRHNKLSLRPWITVTESIRETSREGHIIISIVNSGVGPAIIKEFILRSNDIVESRNNIPDYINFMRKKRDGITISPLAFYIPGSVIEANDKNELWEIKYKVTPENLRLVHKLSVSVKYKSIYQEEIFSYDSRVRDKFTGRESL